MRNKTQPLNEINIKAFYILSKEIGLENTVRFINQFTTGYGNYTEERRKIFNKKTVSEIVCKKGCLDIFLDYVCTEKEE